MLRTRLGGRIAKGLSAIFDPDKLGAGGSRGPKEKAGCGRAGREKKSARPQVRPPDPL